MNDKLKHYIGGAIISFLMLAFFIMFIQKPYYGWHIGAAAIMTVISAVGKELVWDKWLKMGTPELDDVLYTIYGGWSICIIWAIVETIIYVIKYGF